LPTFEFGSFGCNLEGHLFQNVACATAHGGRLCVDPKAGSLLVLAIMGPFGPDWFLHEADWLSQAPRCSIFASQKKKCSIFVHSFVWLRSLAPMVQVMLVWKPASHVQPGSDDEK